MAKKTMVAILMCAVMTLVAAAPMVVASTHLVLKGDQGPRASALTWEYVPEDYGIWTGHIVNNGLRSLMVDVYDNTTGVPEQIMHQRIRFAAVGAYPTGEVDTAGVIVSPTHKYSITVTPSGPKGSSCTVDDPYVVPPIPPVAIFTWSALDRLILSVNGSDSYDPDGVIVSYAWDFGDGLSAVGMTSIHNYAAAGRYTITLIVTDDSGMVGLASESVAVDPTPPVLPMFVYYVDFLNVIVDASASSDPDGAIASYAWNWGDGTNGSGITATHAYATPGNYTITLTMTDIFGGTYSISKVVTVTQRLEPPVAMFVVTVIYFTVAVDGSASYDRDGGPIVAYDWDFGDGSSATGMTATHTYAAAGTHQITLTVTDNDGLTGSMTRQLHWGTQPFPPVANFTVVVDDLTVNVDGSSSYDVDGTIVSYAWTFGDGATAIGRTATHTYAANGVYAITLTVTDNAGLTGTASRQVTCVGIDPPPVAIFSAQVEGMSVFVDGSGSYGTISSYAWDFGDGSSAYGITATHTYANLGTKTITLTVTDDQGMIGSASHQVVVDYSPPPPPTFVCQVSGLTVAVEGIGFDIVSYFWNWGDGSNGTGMTANHTYTTYGDKIITMTTTDTNGLTHSVSKTVFLSP